MAKLTLSIDDRVIAHAKKYAKAHETSVSKMVENYLRNWMEPLPERELNPIVASLIGIAKSADPDGYQKHLIEKYGK